MLRRSHRHGAVAALLAAQVAFITPHTAVAQAVEPPAPSSKSAPTLRVMLHPSAAPRGTLPDEVRQRLEAVAGIPFSVLGVTRTGALELAVGDAADRAARRATPAQRPRGAVGGAAERGMAAKSTRVRRAESAPAHKLMVRLADGANADAAAARLAVLAGAPVTRRAHAGQRPGVGAGPAAHRGGDGGSRRGVRTGPGRALRRPGAPRDPARRADPLRSALHGAVVAVRDQGAGRLGAGNGQRRDHRRGGRYGHRGASRPRRPHPARLRLHQRARPLARRRRARCRSARRGRLAERRRLRRPRRAGLVLPRALRGRAHRREREQRRRHRGPRLVGADPAGARARQVRRDLRGRARRRAVGHGRDGRRRARESASGEGRQPEPRRAGPLRRRDPGGDRRRARAGRGDRRQRRQRERGRLRTSRRATAAG